MTTEWKSSVFTTIFTCDSGDLLLHNGFMGAVARVPAHQAEHIRELLKHGAKEFDSHDPVVSELCEQGFLVPSDLKERQVLEQVLDKERSDRLGLMILPHENCNFRCVYCYEKFKRGKMGQDVVKGLKAFVDQNVGKYCGLGISWFGGEPLLGYDVICDLSASFIDSCDRYGGTYWSGMSTNGYLLTPEMVDSLFEHGVKSFQICVDGPEAMHNRKRKLAGGGGTYKRIVENLLRMRDREEDFFVSIRVNFDNESVPVIEKWLIDEIAPRFAHDPRFGLHFEPITKRGGPNDSTLDVCDLQLAFSLRARFFEEALTLGFSDLTVKKFLIPHGLVCYAAREPSFIVGSDGAVYKCSLAFNDSRNRVGALTSDGQLLLDDAKVSMWTSLEGRDTSDCDSCSFYPCCQGRKCPYVTITQNKPACPITQGMYATLVRLVAFGQGSDFRQEYRSI
ncbi:MAG: radical SAM protein [Anaerolineae bacterium]|nr:radical SAM protein [Anaerolineae bacterium]